MSYGVVIGGLLQLLAHLIAIHFNSMNKVLYGGLLRWRRFSEVKSETDGFFKRFTLAIWGGGTAQISSFLDTVMASFLVTGSISYLYFANRVFQFPLAIFAIATTIAIFPRVSKLIKQNRDGEARKIFKKSFWLLAYMLSLSTLIGVLFAEEIVQLLFERGAFSEADRLATAQVLIFYLLGLSIFGVSKLFSLWLYAHERIGTSAKISTYSLIVKIVSALLLIQPLGASGLALSTTISSLTLLVFTLNEFGWKNIRVIIFDKLGLYLIIVLAFVYQIYLFYFLSL
jgi:putative peptidoglycan lipid II flippase